MTALQDLIEYLEGIEKRDNIPSWVITTAKNYLQIEKEQIKEAFFAGCEFENGEHKSQESYNKFTGNQQPNKEMNFEQWYKENYH